MDVGIKCVMYLFCVCGGIVLVVGCFFFQAEDGIRDLVRSRGLGDVYKRQMLMIVLVSLSSIFMFLSVSTWLAARSSISEAQKAYTSIAVAAENEFLKDINTYKNGIYDYSSLIGMYEAAEKSEHVEYADVRDKCMAYNSAIKTTTSGMVDEYTPISAVDYPYDLCVVVGTCVSVEYKRSFELKTSQSDDNLDILRVVAKLELDFNASPVLSDDYSYSRYISVSTDQFDFDFSDIFQVGEKYILYGSKTYSQYPKTEMYRDSKTVFYIENILPVDIYNRDENDPNYEIIKFEPYMHEILGTCLLYTSDVADDPLCVDLGGRRLIKKKNQTTHTPRRKYHLNPH